MTRFIYSLIRFVPDPAKGEFVNLGAIVGSDETDDWDVRQISNDKRARAIDDRGVLGAVWAFVDFIGRAIDRVDQDPPGPGARHQVASEEWLSQLHRDMQNTVQLSRPTPVIAGDAETALDLVFEELIVDPTQQRLGFVTKRRVYGAMLQAYRQVASIAAGHLRTRPRLVARGYETKLDFAVTNGRALQLSHAWSLQTTEQRLLAEQVRAWGWTIRELRNHGGAIQTDDGLRFDVPAQVNVMVGCAPPGDGADAQGAREAVNVFQELDIPVIPMEQVGQIAERANTLLTS